MPTISDNETILNGSLHPLPISTEKWEEYRKQKHLLRPFVRGFYDLQTMRIESGARLFANFVSKIDWSEYNIEEKPKKGKAKADDDSDFLENAGADAIPDETDMGNVGTNLDDFVSEKNAIKAKKSKILMKLLTDDYTLVTERIARNRSLPQKTDFKPTPRISYYTELVLIHNFLTMYNHEKAMLRQLSDILLDYNVYNHILKNTVGIGPTIAGVLISEFDIYFARYPSQFVAYAGLDVGPDGKARSRRADHLVKREYRAKDGSIQEKLSITFNPFLQAKMLAVVGTSFLRTKSPYTEHYYNYKVRKTAQNATMEIPRNKINIHRMAIRYMVSKFLIDLHIKWRELEGLPVARPWAEEKLVRTFPHGGIVGVTHMPHA